ncbi:BZ3500_MvSof-1268-A1-R1_Chr9g10857 [Microbotryum saponariae]|uniref:BZ3500_MvSof-1268-A1-R1_Chr9g10857 protein n=1 Tax=Microbotryum saponariae TaxID=289078 RepID=A0A2X0M8X7_9BASI|nr:BZ3501_MvSof-1269-A2-R1_Chr9g10605 [Microbotryum saponariae]SDA00815.1 BZ3500_MvSof-1268-A1-R1_Chr9g10857 [Microbotryum saponariae]
MQRVSLRLVHILTRATSSSFIHAATPPTSLAPLHRHFASSQHLYSQPSSQSIPTLPPHPLSRAAMPDSISVTFLGTAAGKPSPTRNVSSLAIKVDKAIWVVDAGEATQHQFQKSKLKMSQITHIFITHMHGDHVNGLPGLLCTASEGHAQLDQTLTGSGASALTSSDEPATIIYGPSGLRQFLRTTLSLTYSYLARPYVVHELLFPGDPICPPPPSASTSNSPSTEDEGAPHRGVLMNERPGLDLWINEASQGWEDFVALADGAVKVSAGPIKHTVPCLGYIFHESPRPLPLDPKLYIPHLKRNAPALLATQGIRNPLSLLSVLTSQRKSLTLPDGTLLHPPALGPKGRKLVVLGDTYDALGGSIERWSQDADLVIHEATNAFLPQSDESQRNKPDITLESVRRKAKEHGHSTPEGAGEFARRVGAKALVMNHLSGRYTDYGLKEEDGEAMEETEGVRAGRGMLREMEDLATRAWLGDAQEGEGEGRPRARTARDLMEVVVKRRDKM